MAVQAIDEAAFADAIKTQLSFPSTGYRIDLLHDSRSYTYRG